MPPPPPPLKLPNARLPPPPLGAVAGKRDVARRNVGEIGDEDRTPEPGTAAAAEVAAIAAPRLGVSDHNVLAGDSDRDLRRRAGRPGADEQAAELVVARHRA